MNYEKDTIRCNDGSELSFTFYGHASLMIEHNGRFIYFDPVGMFADYSSQPKADVIMLTHQHDDHMDPEAINQILKDDTIIVGTPTVAEELGSYKITVMRNGDKMNVNGYMNVEALPAHNTTAGRDIFHPAGRDNGYLVTIGGTRIYIASDGENTEMMKSQRNIDYAFLPVNQPYTMTVDQVVEAVEAIKPKVFYPIHYGQTDFVTDIDALVSKLDGSGIEVRIRKME